VEPRDQFERQAIRWIAEMRKWHMTRVQPPAHARYVKCKKSRKAA
jgi:hypothetical protein